MTLRPRSDEILASVLWSLEEFIVPELSDPYAISVGHTITNLLRHLALRVELEPPALFAGNAELRELLAEIARYARAAGVAELADDLERALAETTPASDYPSVSRLTDDALALRAALDRSIRALQAAPSESKEYLALRARIREWIGRALAREAEWIVPAFSGIRR
jgi:hypothetical protein